MTTPQDRRRAVQRALGIRDDGIMGPITVRAILKGIDEGQVVALEQPAAPSQPAAPASPVIAAPRRGIVRVIMHWTAGANRASALDREHYHWLTESDGKLVQGDTPEEENISTADGIYAAHTLALNTGSIGMAMCGMMGAKDRPFVLGTAPLTQVQVAAFCRHVAEVCRRWGIPIKRETCLTHAEVQPTLNIRQKGKWDIAWLPGMGNPGDPVEVGDRLRDMIRAAG
jgi:hypothetical protein